MAESKMHEHSAPACSNGSHSAVCQAACTANAVPGEDIICDMIGGTAFCNHWPPASEKYLEVIRKRGGGGPRK